MKPQFLISYQSGIIDADYKEQNSADVTISVLKLDVPLLVGLKIFGPLSIEAGPVYSRMIYATQDFNGNTVNIEPNGIGYRAGANVQLGIIGLNVSYQGVWNNSSVSSSFFLFSKLG